MNRTFAVAGSGGVYCGRIFGNGVIDTETDVSKIYLTRIEKKTLKKFKHQYIDSYGEFPEDLKPLLYKGLICEKEYRTGGSFSPIDHVEIDVSDLATQYYIYRREHFIEKRLPIGISILALLVSAIAMLRSFFACK